MADWSREEVEATVADYFEMLAAELSGVPYSKARHRRRLVDRLNGRSEASIEFKHAQVSGWARAGNCWMSQRRTPTSRSSCRRSRIFFLC